MTEKIAYNSMYWKIKCKNDSHIASQSLYSLEWMLDAGEWIYEKDRLSWEAWIYFDTCEGEHWNERMWMVLK